MSKEAAEAARGGMEDRMHRLRGTYRARILVGAAIVVIGAIVFLFPIEGWAFLFEWGLPAAVVFLGAAEIFGALFRKKEEKFVDVAIGSIVVMLGIILFATTYAEVLIIVFALTAWLLGSAFLFLRSFMRESKVSKKDAKPKLVIGLISLAMGIGVLFVPEGILILLMFALGLMIMLAGAFLVTSGIGLRRASKTIEENRAESSKQTRAVDR